MKQLSFQRSWGQANIGWAQLSAALEKVAHTAPLPTPRSFLALYPPPLLYQAGLTAFLGQLKMNHVHARRVNLAFQRLATLALGCL